MVFLFSSNNAVAKTPKGYHSLSGNTVESEHYEIRKIDSVSDNVYFDEINNNFIIGWYGYKKINEKGYVIDSYVHSGDLFISGTFFDEKTYIDWAITGNKIPQKYSRIIDADRLSDDEFKHYIDSTDEVEFEQFYGDKKWARAFLKIEDRWMVLETVKRFDDFSIEVGKNYIQNKKNRLMRLKSAGNRQLIFSKGIEKNKNLEGLDNKLSIKHFDKKGSSSIPFLDINGRGWDGDYGMGYFRIVHQNETLYFKASTIKTYTVKTYGYSPRIEIYMAPEQYRSRVSIALIKLNNAEKSERESNEVGMYVLREKINISDEAIANYEKRGVSFGTYLFHKNKFDWKPVFEGFADKSGKIQSISYFTGEKESIKKPLETPIALKSRTIPKEISFTWDRSIKDSKGFSIFFERRLFQWDSPQESINFKLILDRDEMVEIFQRLSTERKLIELKFVMENLDNNSAFLSTWITSGVETLKVENARLKTVDNSLDFNRDALRMHFERGRINIDYLAALESIKALPEYFLSSGSIVKESYFSDEYALDLAQQSTKLLIAQLSTSELKNVRRILTHYIDKILPYVSRVKKNNDVASLGLVYCTASRDRKMCKKIFDKLLPSLDVNKLDNEILLYNLACYYSVNDEKDNMLKTIKRAVKYGKTSAQFMQDSDFEKYWKDTDFLSAIN